MDERALLGRVAEIIGPEPVADDCAILPAGDDYLVLTIDMLHEATDFPAGMTEWQMGWMAVAATLSDIASMGAAPTAILLAAGLDSPDRLLPIIEGALACCLAFGTRLLGGDIDHHDELTLVSTGLGRVARDSIIRRSGADPGDLVCVTGTPGRAQAGLSGYTQHRSALLEPQPRLREGRILGNYGVSCGMDLSDGLSISLYDLLAVNDCGFALASTALPLPAGVPPAEALEFALFGGGDYELLFCIPPGKFPVPGVSATAIGTVIAERTVLFDRQPLVQRGYEHRWDVLK